MKAKKRASQPQAQQQHLQHLFLVVSASSASLESAPASKGAMTWGTMSTKGATTKGPTSQFSNKLRRELKGSNCLEHISVPEQQ
mmetsp:Transcript_19309/g.44920  ORF Transcript_19309/g.44920 Transcript_19309/m.44920 type:complete len:84 (+) Transcript_19309:74-325(+)